MRDVGNQKPDIPGLEKEIQPEIKTIVLFTLSGDDALAVLRIIGPVNQLGLQVIRGYEDGKLHLDRIAEGDILVIQRDFPGRLVEYEQVMAAAHAQSKPVVFDLDDLLIELPENHPDRIRNHFTGALLPMLQALMEVDLITVPTQALRKYLLTYHERVEVFPNYLNDTLWKLREPANPKPENDPLTIGYMGGHSHKPDLQMILRALTEVLKKYPEKVRFHFWGIEPPAEIAEISRVDWCPPKSYLYADFTEYFQTQTADIMIAPLENNLFNSCKSPIKFLEYSALGVPGVYSKVAPYTEIVEDADEGLLVAEQSEWVNALTKLIEDASLRRQIAVNAQQKITTEWLLSKNAEKLLQIYQDCVTKYKGPRKPILPMYSVIKSITSQTYDDTQIKGQLLHSKIDEVKNKTNEIKKLQGELNRLESVKKDLENNLDEKQNVIQSLQSQNSQLDVRAKELEAEVLSYALSPSWKITRPLRKLSRKIKKEAG